MTFTFAHSWHYPIRASQRRTSGEVVFGGYGVGARGNYLMLLKTTTQDFEKHRAECLKWYNSITLD